MKARLTHAIAPLDGLRGLAILFVLWHHLYSFGLKWYVPMTPGWLMYGSIFAASGVFLFFALSGFLLFLPYARALLAGQNWPDARRFYLRRLLRIFPVYVVAVFILLFLGNGFAFPAPVATSLLAGTLLYDWYPKAFSVLIAVNPPFWTLTIEWQFYLVLPLLALGLRWLAGQYQGWHRAKRLVLGLLALVMIGLDIRLLASMAHYTSGWPNPGIPAPLQLCYALVYGVKGKYLEVFALGMGSSLLYVWGVEQGHLNARRCWSRIALSGALVALGGALLFALASGHLDLTRNSPDEWTFPASPLWSVLGEWTYGVAFCLLLLAVVLSPGLSRLFSFAPLRWTGIISYSLYIWHWPLLNAARGLFTSFGQMIVAMSLLIFLVATVSYWVIERPFLRWRHAVRAPEKSVAVEMKSSGG
jgi:peptidoglycan/LPS O-acetylase OafA/YrhL